MKLTNVIKNPKITRALYRTKLEIVKASPEIAMVAGGVCIVAGVVFAAKGGVKAKAVIDEKNETMQSVRKCREENPDMYSEEDKQRDTVIVYSKMAVGLAKVYAPAIGFTAAGIGLMVLSRNILRSRNAALAAALATTTTSFKEYRKRVVEKYGADIDQMLRHNMRMEEIETKETNPETGKEETKKQTFRVVNNKDISEYAKIFDEYNRNWKNNPNSNLLFLRSQQRYATDLLRLQGYLFLNDVYEMLGFDPTKEGQVVGWIYNPDDPNFKGDNYVDFGIYNVARERARDFVNGYEPSILLDFNVDGDIYQNFEGYIRN